MLFPRATLLFCLLALTTASLPAAPRVILAGNPPLTSEIAGKAAGFFEWLLELHFTPSQQQEYETLLAKQWGDEGSRKSTLALVQNVDRLGSVSADKKREVQASVLDAMRKSHDDDSRWLLAIYQAAHPQEVAASAPAAQQRGNLTAARLVGKWRDTRSAAVQYKNSATGVMAPTNGHSFFYQFFPDGTYEYNGLMQVTTYGCSTQLYGNDSGKYHLEGDRLTVQPEKGTMRTQQNCGSTGNTEKPANLDKREYVAHFETDSSGALTLVVNGVEGGTRPNYFRAEK